MRIIFHDPGSAPEPWLEGLRQAFPGAVIEPWQPGAAPADYALVWAPPQQLLDEQTQLKALFNLGAGVDVLLQRRLPAGLPLYRLDDAGMAVQMAEYVCQALIRHFRALDQIEADTRAGRWLRRAPRRRADFPVGIMGLGVLGQRVLRAVQAFEFPVCGWSRSPRAIEGVTTYSGAQALPAFLSATRVLVNLLPLTPETRDILNRDTLGQLQPSGYLIQVARGAHLVDEDLLSLLDSGHLAGATLDVFRTEPLPADHAFWSHPKITLTPHTSAITLREESLAQIVERIRALQAGADPQSLIGLVRPELGY